MLLQVLPSPFGAAIGIGSATTISVKFGQKDYETAENILGNTITLNLLVGLSITIICLVFIDPILRFFGASDATIPYARSFMQVILLGNAISHMYFGLNAVLRAASKPRQAMNATLFTVVMNILLDMIFIWWWHWGIRGAAFATVISQAMALCYQLHLFADQSQLLHLKKGIYRLKANLVKNIIGIGISPFLMNVCSCIIVIFMNNLLVRYGGDMAVGSYGIANSIALIFIMFVMGVNQGMQPIAGYNYGSQQTDRLFRVLKLSIFAATGIMITGWLIAMFLPYYCARMFTTDSELIRQSMRAIRINQLLFPVVGFQMVIANFFQCIGKVKVSIFLSLSRQLLILLPALFILSLLFKLDGVWAALPTSDLTAAVIAAIVMAIYMKKLKLQLNNPANEQ